MSSDYLIGAKGGGGSFRNTPDNLRSEDTFEAVVGIVANRARLAPGGLQNLYLDDVPIEDGQGNAVFKDFIAELFEGDPTVLEPITLRLGQSAGPTGVNLNITNSYTNGDPGDWVNAATTQTDINFVDLRFIVQQLFKQTKKGIYEQTATLEIQMRPSGTTNWINPLLDVSAPTYDPEGVVLTGIAARRAYIPASQWNPLDQTEWNVPTPGYLTITGKTTSPYIKELRVAVPNEGDYANKSWQVRVRLIEQDYVVSGDDGENEDRRTLTFESITGVSASEFGGTEAWRGLSYLTIYGKATDQISGVPTMTGVYDVGEHLVPPNSVWNPTTREYTGAVWDGVTTQLAWTQCPAFQIKGLIEDDLSGISALAPGSTLNKWDALEASKWFSTLVPDGLGGTHPRYSMNWIIEQPMQVHELVNYLAGAVGSFCWDEGDGQWRMKVEKPEDPVMIFTKENISGDFVYSHTDFDARYNDITGVFRNEELRFKEDRVRVFDDTSITNTGRRHLSIPLIGCTNRQEALRRLKIRLLTSLNEIRSVTFTTNRQGLFLEPFSVIAVADADLNADMALRSTGRIVSIDGTRTEITLRDTVRLEVGVAYTITCTIPNPNYDPETTTEPADPSWREPTITITRNVTNTTGQLGDVTVLYLDTALPTPFPDYAPIALGAVGLPALPKQYRVLNVKPDEKGELVTVTAHEIYTPKWTESDSVTESEYSSHNITRTVPSPLEPSGGIFHIETFTGDYTTRRVLVIDWDRPGSLFLNGFRLEMRFNGGQWQALGDTKDTFYELPDPSIGLYEIRVYSKDRRGLESIPLSASYEITEADLVVPTPLLSNAAITVPADTDGNVASWTGVGGDFILWSSVGALAAGITYEVLAGATGGLVVNIDTAGTYTVSDMTSDFGQATLRATWQGLEFDLVLSISKSRAGSDGSAAKTLTLISNRQTIYYDAAGAPSPATQTTTFNVNKQNTIATVNWSLTDAEGTNLTPVTDYLSAATGDSVTMTEAQFASARGTTSGVIVTASVTDGPVISDKISIVKVQEGAAGNNAKTITVSTDRQNFTFDSGGNLYPPTQSAIATANPQNFTGGDVVWTYEDNLGTPSATLAGLVTATSANVRTIPSSVFTGTPTRLWLEATATGQGAEASLGASVMFLRIRDGASPVDFRLPLTSIVIETDDDGSNGDFSKAFGQASVWHDGQDVTASTTFSEVSETDCTGEINTATDTPVSGHPKGYYQISAISADTGTYVVRAEYDPGSGPVQVDKTIWVTRTKRTPSIRIAQTAFEFVFDHLGNPEPDPQSIEFTATKINSSATVTWEVWANGSQLIPTTNYLSSDTGASVTMSDTQFLAALTAAGSGDQLVINAVLGASVSSTATGVRKRVLAAPPKSWTLAGEREYVSVDGDDNADPASQTNVFTATVTNPTTAVTFTWTVTDNAGNPKTPLASYGTVSGTGNDTFTQTVSQALSAADGSGALKVTATPDDAALLPLTKTVQVRGTGASALGLNVTQDRTTITRDPFGNVWPVSQTTTLAAVRRNFTGGTVSWTIKDGAQNTLSPVTDYLSAATGDTVTIAADKVVAGAGATRFVDIQASVNGLVWGARIYVDQPGTASDNQWIDPQFNTLDTLWAETIASTWPSNYALATDGLSWSYQFKNYLAVSSGSAFGSGSRSIKVASGLPVRYAGEKFYMGFSGGKTIGSGTYKAGIYLKFYNASGAQVGTTQKLVTDTLFTTTSDWPQINSPAITAPAGAATYEYGWTLDYVSNLLLSIFRFANPYVQRIPPGADNTATQLPDLFAYHAGASLVQEVSVDGISTAVKHYPTALALKRMIGATDVSASSAWSLTASSGITASVGAATGVITISAMPASGGYIDVTSTRNNINLKTRISFVPTYDVVPQEGGTTSTAGITAAQASVSNTTYGTTPVLGPMPVTSSPTGKIDIGRTIKTTPAGTGTGSLEMKGQARTKAGPGAWFDIALIDLVGPLTYSAEEVITGIGGATQIGTTGFANDTEYEVQILARKPTGTTSAMKLLNGTKYWFRTSLS